MLPIINTVIKAAIRDKVTGLLVNFEINLSISNS
jgi:hypothetical protein